MTQAVAVKQDRFIGFTVGWWLLVAVTAVSVVGHALLLFVADGEEVLFIGWTTMNLYAFVVLLTAYRRREDWGWWATWLMPTSYASLSLFDSDVGPGYLGVAVLMAVAQLAARSAFRDRSSREEEQRT